ncbi:Pimeloyl-ACP methyl ester carboxylesterase [Oryzisolibacter propanilivorax]|uniref:Pimeloyl-ACP methyl ester carboxylesterase n=1 Tax=Oryzisolibacter propanilivorax TaxID=1527607 RepID=A0A1G9RNQ6_9BURK|nr:alpha/beta hydrolase [Oryzisolibacter propanilivorax]SDM24710.1 Pimeloyl-ACP methyl ester carboxylesterase [Oryzisolibacter propanilivorax]
MPHATSTLAPDVPFQDHWIGTGLGRVLARRWQPAGTDAATRAPAPIVLLHDSLGCIALWRDFPALLARRTGRAVIAYDRPGFGQSMPRSGALPLDFVEREAWEVFTPLRTQLGLERFAVFGHSVGGGMAVHCAARHAAHCEALITEAAQAFVEERTLAGIRQAQAAFADPAERARLARYHGERTDWVLNAWISTWLSPAFADFSLQPALAQVRCPALVLHGSEDEYGSQAHPLRIAAQVAGPAQLCLMPGVRHVPHRERAEEVARRVVDFLQACPPAAQ